MASQGGPAWPNNALTEFLVSVVICKSQSWQGMTTKVEIGFTAMPGVLRTTRSNKQESFLQGVWLATKP